MTSAWLTRVYQRDHWTDFLTPDDIDILPDDAGPLCVAEDPDTGYQCTVPVGDHGLRHLASDGEHVVAIWPTRYRKA